MAAKIQLGRSTPEAQGVSSAAILAFIDDIEASNLELHSMMLLRHGQVVTEGWWKPYGAENPHMLFSLTKSFTSSAVGFAVAEGKLTIDDPVISFFPEDAPAKPSKNLAAMRVRHLLTMSTGHHEDSTERTGSRADGNWVKGFFSMPVKHEPGSLFIYNSGASHILSAIVQRVVGMPILEYLKPRLFEPLGIENMAWQTDPRGINTGGWGLSIKTEDIARFGQMYLQKGQWNGQQILPAEWVEMATSKQVSNESGSTTDWQQGYGFQFWRCQNNAFRGDGAFGQYCIVMPDQDAVLAITSGVGDMQAVLDRVWKHILPGLTPEAAENLAAESILQQRLALRLAKLTLRSPRGKSASEMVRQVNGKVYTFEENPAGVKSLSIAFTGKTVTLTVRNNAGKHALVCGTEGWLLGKTALSVETARRNAPFSGAWPVGAACTWTAEDTFLVTAQLYETPFSYTMTCKFDGSEVTVDVSYNVAFGPVQNPTLVGRIAPPNTGF
jgi:CubicO group peptidase (beta-lactamase class C family)